MVGTLMGAETRRFIKLTLPRLTPILRRYRSIRKPCYRSHPIIRDPSLQLFPSRPGDQKARYYRSSWNELIIHSRGLDRFDNPRKHPKFEVKIWWIHIGIPGMPKP